MFVMSQDRNTVVETTGKYFWVGEDDWSDKDTISFEVIVNTPDNGNTSIAKYHTREKALAELQRLYAHYEAGVRVFSFVKDVISFKERDKQ